MRISDLSSDVCSSDRTSPFGCGGGGGGARSGGFRPGGAQFDFGGEAGDIGDIFEGLFGQRQQGGGGGFSSGFGFNRGPKPKGANIAYRLQVPFTDAAALKPQRITLGDGSRSEEHTSELQSLLRSSYAVFCLKKKKKNNKQI